VAKRGGSPLVALNLFRNVSYARGLGSILLLFGGLSSFSFVMGQFLQRGLQMTPAGAGIVFGALSLSFLHSSLGAVKLVGRFGPRVLLSGLTVLLLGQLVVIAIALIWRGNLNGFALIPIFAIYGWGQGLAVPQVIRQTMNSISGSDAGAASGVLSTVQQIAFSLGVSVIGGVFFGIADKTGTPDAYAFGLAMAFGISFIFVLIARVLVAQMLRLNDQNPVQTSRPLWPRRKWSATFYKSRSIS
jgi:Na+/melibiose symporter-like transporter